LNLIIEDGWIYLALLVGVISCFVLPYVKKVSNWFITIIHEFGHAITALFLGGGIQGIRLHSDGSGSTHTYQSNGILYKLVRRIILFAGYSFPIYIGLALLIVAALGKYELGSILLVIIGILTFVFLRNWFGFLIIFVYFGTLIAFWLMRFQVDNKYLIIFMGFLFLIGGLHDIIQVSKIVFRKEVAAESDFHLLASESWFPAPVWYITFIIVQTIIISVTLLTLQISVTFQ